ncbi:MAG: tail fiber protein [Nitrospirae bacterium]|nr:tail fiber protein [Nitrospirota bacterium]
MYRTRLIKIILLTAVVVLFSVVASHAVTVPQMINYSGTLNGINGNPVANGNYSMEFRIYNVASGGVALWTEKWDTTTSQVAVVSGTFNVMLGAIDKVNNPIPANFFQENPETFLGIKVGNDSEMLPRQKITSVGYALSAWNGVPKGGIIMWSGAITDIPAGWALCDGSNGTPNLRDRFVVGAGSGYAVHATGGTTTNNISHTHSGPSHQHGIFGNDLNHYHGVNGHTHDYIGSTGISPQRRDASTSGSTDFSDRDHTHSYSGTTDAGTLYATKWASEQGFNLNHNHGGATDANGTGQTGSEGSTSLENRPPYYALAFIMKL